MAWRSSQVGGKSEKLTAAGPELVVVWPLGSGKLSGRRLPVASHQSPLQVFAQPGSDPLNPPVGLHCLTSLSRH